MEPCPPSGFPLLKTSPSPAQSPYCSDIGCYSLVHGPGEFLGGPSPGGRSQASGQLNWREFHQLDSDGLLPSVIRSASGTLRMKGASLSSRLSLCPSRSQPSHRTHRDTTSCSQAFACLPILQLQGKGTMSSA